ncbi:arylamine N-acetyltransferase 1 [Amniculicola lignicola CBS 123094]|uniref:Arylamine N-acetyltransferase 1 n=1 Tax=Amniculicola lignicola CBS 123094 TaxID=1392246 RepID=A0A6A5WW72_9PLEO|nr:arylamine N-acetyltransferase 1 [Amniculicola lignicola CBS 123094]
MSAVPRPTYSKPRITQYFSRLKLTEEQRIYDVAGLKPEDALRYLTHLQQHHLVEIPFENLTLHYSHHRQISIHPEELFKKIIADGNGRGGYCMENNTLFGTLLYSLGFQIYSAGARVMDGGVWSGWGHMVNLITIGSDKYFVDVGFGGNGPISPMKLDKSGTTQQHIQPATARLQWRNIPGNTDENQRLWVYEIQITGGGEFQIIYCFTELEFILQDYKMMNFYSSNSPRTFFTQVIVGEKKVWGGAKDDELVGNLILGNNNLKLRINGKTEKEIPFKTEQERLDAIKEHFGIAFGPTEKESIQGLTSEITGT